MRRSICEPLSNDTLQCTVGALHVINTELDPIVVAEIEFGKVTVQVLLSAMLIDVWTADPDKIIAAANRGHQVLDSIH
jgi:hypothetical protein